MNFPSLSILVVDHEPLSRILLERFLKHAGHTVMVAENGDDAVKLFQQHAFDMIVLDLMLPSSTSGYETVKRLKTLAHTRWIPVIIVSEMAAPEDQVRGLQAGGDDYLTKPVNLSVLAYKIQAMQRIAAMQNALADTLRSLEHYRKKTELELGLARHMLRQLNHGDELENLGVDYFNLPAGAFSGDLVTAAGNIAGVRHVLLADVTGHGLSSALNAIPLLEAFFEMVKCGSTLEELCRELNSRLKRILPPGYFIAATIVMLDRENSVIRAWNGGLPTAWFILPDGKIHWRWNSRHLPLGILKDGEFDASTEIMPWCEPGQIVMFSDGLIEARAASGEAFGELRIENICREAPETERLLQTRLRLMEFLAETRPHDDVSLVAIQCG